MSAPFDLAVVIDDDPDIALAARLALRDLFGRIETLASPDEQVRGGHARERRTKYALFDLE